MSSSMKLKIFRAVSKTAYVLNKWTVFFHSINFFFRQDFYSAWNPGDTIPFRSRRKNSEPSSRNKKQKIFHRAWARPWSPTDLKNGSVTFRPTDTLVFWCLWLTRRSGHYRDPGPNFAALSKTWLLVFFSVWSFLHQTLLSFFVRSFSSLLDKMNQGLLLFSF